MIDSVPNKTLDFVSNTESKTAISDVKDVLIQSIFLRKIGK